MKNKVQDFIPAHLLLDKPPGADGYKESEKPAPLMFSQEILQEMAINPENCGIICVHGEAMNPTIKGKADLLIDFSDKALADGHIYALEIGTRTLVRRVKLYLRHIVLVCAGI